MCDLFVNDAKNFSVDLLSLLKKCLLVLLLTFHYIYKLI
jgi:hypothetical protein